MRVRENVNFTFFARMTNGLPAAFPEFFDFLSDYLQRKKKPMWYGVVVLEFCCREFY